MADKDPRGRRRQWPPVAMSARKSAPIRAGGVNVRRLMLSRATTSDQKHEEDEEKEPNNECGNPFCGQILANRYAKFCEDKPMCQRYRALKLQCLANAQAEEDEEDTRPLSLVIRKKEIETFAIPRKKTERGKRRLHLSVDSESSSSSPRKDKMLKKQKKEQLLDKKKEKMKRTRDTMEKNGTTTPSRSPSVGSSSAEKYQPLPERLKKRMSPQNSKTKPTEISAGSSSAEENQALTERKKRMQAKVRPPETNSNAETGTGITDVSRIKKRRLNRHVSADDVLSRSTSSSPVRAASVASVAINSNWKIPRTKPRVKTAAQAIKNMNVELVPLGVASQASTTGGGRYVQNGNRSGAPSVRTTDPRPRPPVKTKFTAPVVPAAPPIVAHLSASSRPLVPPSAAPPSASIRPTQTTQPTVPAPQPPQIQPSLPPLPPSSAPVLRPIGPRAVTPSSSPAKTTTVISSSNSSSISTTRPNGSATTGSAGIQRISTSDYLKNRKSDQERRPQGDRVDHQTSRSSSLERSTRLADDRASGFPPPPPYPTGPPGYHRSDSAPLPSYRESRPPVDPRRQYPEADVRHRQPYYEMEGNRMEYRARSEGRGELNDISTSEEWGARNFPPRDRYSPRQQELSSIGASNEGYDYATDTHFSPASPSAEQTYWREPSREKPPPPQRAPSPRRNEPAPPQRAPSPRRNELERTNIDRENSDCDEVDEDTPTFSYHDTFLPGLLYVFIHKLPQSLEAVFNVTKKPRKMNWYIKYVERIERLCKPFDLQIKFDGLKAMVTVRDREWLTLQGTSTVTLYLDVIKSLRAEAMTWLRLFEEMEKALAHYRGIYGSQANESYTFLRAWNDLKNPGNYISLSRQSNYFCGARLHHWNFVVGKVEIGSGSHEEKREAFRLATVSALDFLLSIGRGVRRPSRKSEVKRERALEANRSSSRERRQSPGRESISNTIRASQENGQANGISTTRSPSAVDPPSSTIQLAVGGPASSIESQLSTEVSSTAEPRSSAEPSSTSVAVERTEKPVVTIIPTNSNHAVAEAAEQSDPGEEMSISDASDLGAVTPAGSPHASTSLPSESSSGIAPTASGSNPKSTTSAALAVTSAHTTSMVTENASTAPLPLTPTVESKPPAAVTMASGDKSVTAIRDAKSASKKTIPETQTKAKAAMPLRRCMMCEMIRMRKPDGERCLRCQQKGPPANGMLDASLGP